MPTDQNGNCSGGDRERGNTRRGELAPSCALCQYMYIPTYIYITCIYVYRTRALLIYIALAERAGQPDVRACNGERERENEGETERAREKWNGLC